LGFELRVKSHRSCLHESNVEGATGQGTEANRNERVEVTDEGTIGRDEENRQKRWVSRPIGTIEAVFADDGDVWRLYQSQNRLRV